VPQAEKHDYFPDWKRDYLAHTVKVEASSQLANILGSNSSQVNSLHHQAIDRLALDLVATAHAPDGIIEAVELPDHPFGLAVQWHPEWLTAHAAMRGLFTAFAEFTRKIRK
jgi:putative glutamine amidotransferase